MAARSRTVRPKGCGRTVTTGIASRRRFRLPHGGWRSPPGLDVCGSDRRHDREQSQRIEWLTDMLGRWAEVHSSGGQLDLRVSEYLVREVRGLMDAVTANKRIALPQSLLYDLELILDTFRNLRFLLSSQFEALAEKEGVRLNQAVGAALPGRGLDMNFVRHLALDPSDVWADKVRGRGAAAFDEELVNAFRFPDVFRDRLFRVNEVAVLEAMEPARKGFMERIAALVAGPLPWLRVDDFRADLTEKRDTYRELMILPAEVFRVRALNSAWVATTAVLAEALGQEVAVLVGTDGITVEIGRRAAELATRPAEQPALVAGEGEPGSSTTAD